MEAANLERGDALAQAPTACGYRWCSFDHPSDGPEPRLRLLSVQRTAEKGCAGRASCPERILRARPGTTVGNETPYACRERGARDGKPRVCDLFSPQIEAFPCHTHILP